ncbi:MAG: nuclear transport factor 2 family protein [Burkholderiales bacterium]
MSATGRAEESGDLARPDAVLREQVLEAGRVLYRAQVAEDAVLLAPLLDDGLVYIHSTGVAESKSEYLAGVVDRLYEYGWIASRDTRLQVFGDAAILNGTVAMTVSAKGAPKQLTHLLFCVIWTRKNGAWLLNLRQATRIPSGDTAATST